MKKKEPVFSSLSESTAFKRSINRQQVNGIGFADLNSHLIDSFLVNQHTNTNDSRYAFSKTVWLFSKLLRKKISAVKEGILLVPVEPEKERSMGLYTPIMQQLDGGDYRLLGVEELFSSLDITVFFRWLLQVPAALRQINKALSVEQASLLKPLKRRLKIDSLIHLLWIAQLRTFFKHSGCRSMLVDWDRHGFQSQLVLAANMEAVHTYTFVHGAIYTPEKFVPLIAEKCLVWGNTHRQFFRQQGEAAEALLTAGNSRFRRELPNRESVQKKYGIPAGKKIILHPSQNFPDLKDHEIVKSLYHHIETDNRFQLAVKVHPSQNNQQLINEVSGLNGLILLPASISAAEALSLAEFAVVVSSTFSIDAMIAGVPVTIYKQPGASLRGIAVDLVEKALVPFLQTQKDFEQLLSTIADKPAIDCIDMESQRQFISDYCEYYGDESAKIIASLLKQ